MQTVRNILLAQLAAGLLAAAIVWIWLGSGRAVPTLLGGLIGVVPNAFLAARLMSPRAGSSAQRLLRAGWIGEAGKLAITVVMFIVVFATLKPLHPEFVFAGYIATLLALPVVLLFDKGR
ncbi:MAG: ATP synthase subunit I [Pseudomonadota bacterium]|nr:ATP synthase subunit I [Pseudomonadota bacterium]